MFNLTKWEPGDIVFVKDALNTGLAEAELVRELKDHGQVCPESFEMELWEVNFTDHLRKEPYNRWILPKNQFV